MRYSIEQKIIDNLLVFMLVMSTGGLLFVFNRNLSYAIFFGLIFFAYLFFGKRLKKSKVNSAVLSLAVVVMLFLINYFFAINEQSVNKYLYYIMVVTCSVLVLLFFNNSRKENVLIDRLYFVLKLIVYHSVFNFIAYFIIGNNLSIVAVFHHECETFLNIFFYTPERNIVNVFGFEFCRNQGLFWEPGVLQAFLNIAFFIEAFIVKKNRLFLLIISFALITTYSTTGLALLVIQGLIYLKEEFKHNKFLIPFIVALTIPIFLVFSVNLEDKVHGDSEASFQKRLFDLTQPLFIAIEHPLTGIGLDIDQFQKLRKEFYFSSSTLKSLQDQIGVESKSTGTDKGSSNSIMFLLAAMGFPTAILFIYMFFKQQIITEKKWLIMILMTISVISEPLLLRPFFFIFIISGFMNIFYKITSHKKQLA